MLPPPLPEDVFAALPPMVQAYIRVLETLAARVVQLEADVTDLKAKLNRNSSNSSLPPSANPLSAKPAPPRPKSGMRRGGQAGHPKNERPRLPPDETHQLTPAVCRGCQHPLAGDDPEPLGHQVLEIPEVKPRVTEYRQHRLTCPKCGIGTCGELPVGTQSGYGPRAQATLAYFSGMLRASKQSTSTAFEDLFGLPISPALACKRQADQPETSYYPLVLIFLYLLGVVGLAEAASGGFDGMRAMARFMAGFFLVFSFFKLLNLSAFADAYVGHDVVAARWRAWGYAYPFVELALGAAYLTGFRPVVTNVATLLVMGVDTVGVVKSLVARRKIRCAGLGTVFNLPMSYVTLVEDLLMVGMAAAMLAARAGTPPVVGL